MTPNTTPQAAEAARLAEELKRLARAFAGAYHLNTGHEPSVSLEYRSWDELEAAIDRLRDLASRADSPVGEAAGSDAAFKNFHRSLCARFGYTHDEKDWRRDLVSLEEHIARLVSEPTEDDPELPGMWEQADFAGGATDCVPAVEAKPTAAEVTYPQPGAAEYNAQMASAVLRQPGSASPSEAQKAVAKVEGGVLVWSKLPKGYDGLLYTHPSAGVGAEPQELPMLPEFIVSKLFYESRFSKDDYDCGSSEFATAIQRAAAASWGIRLKGEQ